MGGGGAGVIDVVGYSNKKVSSVSYIYFSPCIVYWCLPCQPVYFYSIDCLIRAVAVVMNTHQLCSSLLPQTALWTGTGKRPHDTRIIGGLERDIFSWILFNGMNVVDYDHDYD